MSERKQTQFVGFPLLTPQKGERCFAYNRQPSGEGKFSSSGACADNGFSDPLEMRRRCRIQGCTEGDCTFTGKPLPEKFFEDWIFRLQERGGSTQVSSEQPTSSPVPKLLEGIILP